MLSDTNHHASGNGSFVQRGACRIEAAIEGHTHVAAASTAMSDGTRVSSAAEHTRAERHVPRPG